MKNNDLIPVDEFCFSHRIEISFIFSLQKNGLLEIITQDETDFFQADLLPLIEKYIRLYFELDINIEGIESIGHLLDRIHQMQNEITLLRNQLSIHDDSEQIFLP